MDESAEAVPRPPENVAIVDFVSPAPSDVAAINNTAVLATAPPAQSDADLRAFFARPVEIYDGTWSDGGTINTHIDPWSLFLNDTAVSSKLDGYKYLRGNLKLQVMINGTPFHYGRILVSYEPTVYGGLRSYDGDFRQHSCLPHVMIDPTTNTVGHLTAPFISPFEWITVCAGSVSDAKYSAPNQLGKLNLDTLVPLSFANSGVVPDVKLHVLAWMEDVELSYPTNLDYASWTPQADEYEVSEPNSGPISRPLTTLADFATYLGEAPIVGPWARATEMAARGGAKLAALFGFSKPRILKAPNEVVPSKYGNMANVDAADSAISFTLGAKTEVSIDPKLTGHSIDHDELALASFVNRWTVAPTTYPYAVGFSGDILSLDVSPAVGRVDTAALTEMTSLDFGSRPFRSWRGGIEFEFTIVCSRYHRGRLRISYEPDSDAPALANNVYNRNYSRVVDISDTTVFCVTVPYFARTGYKVIPDVTSPYTGYNGRITISTLNELTAPLSTADATIFYRVRGASDFQVADPGNVDIGILTAYDAQSDERDLHVPGEFSLQADVELSEAAERECVDVTMFEAPTHPLVDAIYFGDPVRSFRALLKRYELYTRVNNYLSIPATSTASFSAEVNGFPTPRRDAGLGGNGMYQDNSTPARYTLMNYLAASFLGVRGSTRWCLVDSERSVRGVDYGVARTESTDPFLTRLSHSTIGAWFHQTLSLAAQPAVPYASGSFSDLVATQQSSISGSQVFPSRSNGLRGVHVEVPYYNSLRFRTVPVNNSNPVVNSDLGVWQGFQVTRQFSNPGSVAAGQSAGYDLFVAAGEDYSNIFYKGPPRMWYLYSLGGYGAYNAAGPSTGQSGLRGIVGDN